MGEFFICPICGNKDANKIGYINGKPYCRACISFKGESIDYNVRDELPYEFELNYELTEDQKRISNSVLDNYINHIDTLLIAVCGAGKTEIVFKTISHVLENSGKVGFAIPRKDVVIEIADRLKEVFPSSKVVALYGGNTSILDGDIICLTTHQLYRYEHFFDFLIVDEIDAFPFNGNDVLFSIMKRSVRGNLVLMSATPSRNFIKMFENNAKAILHLNTRFHNHPLPVPIVIKSYSFLCFTYLIKKLKKFISDNKPTFVFVATIEEATKIYNLIKYFVKGGEIVHSKIENRKQIIADFRNGKYKYLVTTAVLERGVTIKNLQVIIYRADHNLYSSHTLIQIAGRVGRKKEAPEGEVIFIVEHTNDEIKKCINDIETANKNLH